MKHLNHVLHQLQNKPWSALYVACIFFMLISLGVLVFYAIQQVAQAGGHQYYLELCRVLLHLPVGSVISLYLIFVVSC
jgi:hypothetical protein